MRKRLEEAGRAKKAKKGFLTPERKKKLRVRQILHVLYSKIAQKLLMLKATEDLKLQQKKRAEERQIVLSERIPVLPELDSLNDGEEFLREHHSLLFRCFAADGRTIPKPHH